MSVLLTLIGKRIADRWKKDEERREITLTNNLELERAHEDRPWAEMGRRLSDLREENEELRTEVERLRAERDQARLDAVDWEIAAKKANGALARVTEIQQECDQARRVHAEQIAKLKAELARLQRGGRR